MAVTLEETIAKQETTWATRLLRSQTFWVVVAIIAACAFLAWRSPAFLTPQRRSGRP